MLFHLFYFIIFVIIWYLILKWEFLMVFLNLFLSAGIITFSWWRKRNISNLELFRLSFILVLNLCKLCYVNLVFGLFFIRLRSYFVIKTINIWTLWTITLHRFFLNNHFFIFRRFWWCTTYYKFFKKCITVNFNRRSFDFPLKFILMFFRKLRFNFT